MTSIRTFLYIRLSFFPISPKLCVAVGSRKATNTIYVLNSLSAWSVEPLLSIHCRIMYKPLLSFGSTRKLADFYYTFFSSIQYNTMLAFNPPIINENIDFRPFHCRFRTHLVNTDVPHSGNFGRFLVYFLSASFASSP